MKVTGNDAHATFAQESGGHRWQRVPPTEKRGRVHTSTLTVAVLPDVQAADFAIPDRDLEITTTRGSGPGGQNRNKVETVVVVKHIPTGLAVRAETERSQHQNRQLAMDLLRSRLKERAEETARQARAKDRKVQVGSGQRADKRRTIRVQDGQVIDHVTGRKWRFDDYTQGKW